MRGGRKNLKRATEEKIVTLEKGQSIMQVVDLRGSNLIEVMDAKEQKLLAIFPAKFQRSMWMKRETFVVIDESGREGAEESGRKVGGMVTQVLYYKQVGVLQKSPDWPEAFKATTREKWNIEIQQSDDPSQEAMSSDDEELPPLERNANRRNPLLSHSRESDFDRDSS